VIDDPLDSRCRFCLEPVRIGDPTNWVQVTVWVHGPKRNGATMQGEDVLAVAHDRCARLAKMGIGVDQGTLL